MLLGLGVAARVVLRRGIIIHRTLDPSLGRCAPGGLLSDVSTGGHRSQRRHHDRHGVKLAEGSPAARQGGDDLQERAEPDQNKTSYGKV
jgi:hypothetical protein